MEIFFELLVQLVVEFLPAVLEVLGGIVGEILLQVFAEGLFELGFHGMVETFNRRRRRNPFLAAGGYLLWGAIIGGLSLLVFRQSLIQKHAHRMLNLLITPVIVGLCMSIPGAYRKKRGRAPLRIDSFFYGCLFALGKADVCLGNRRQV